MIETVKSADGTTIAYERSGDGPALIIVGGAFSNRHGAGELIPLLAAHFSVYAYDRRGRSNSGDTMPYAVEREIEDLRALVAAAGDSARMYGHSSGGVLALEAAAGGVPITRLAVYEPPYMVDDTRQKPPADFAARVQAAVDSGHPDEAAETFLSEAIELPAEVVSMIKQSPNWSGMVDVAHTLPYDIALVGDGSMPVERLARIAVPALAMDGGASPEWARNAVAAVTAGIPGATRVTVEGQEHAAAADVIAPLLIDFLL